MWIPRGNPQIAPKKLEGMKCTPGRTDGQREGKHGGCTWNVGGGSIRKKQRERMINTRKLIARVGGPTGKAQGTQRNIWVRYKEKHRFAFHHDNSFAL